MSNKNQPAQENPHSHQLRAFFAVELAAEARASLAELSGRLQKAAQFTPARFSWVPPENFHITLYFLGNIPLEKAQALADQLPAAAACLAPFSVDLRHLGVFPEDPKKPPRVLWVGAHRVPDQLVQLRTACAGLLARNGLPVPDQDFSPHITLARFRSTKGFGAFRKVMEPYRFWKGGKSETRRVVLMQSITGGGPARYQPWAAGELQGEAGP